MDIRIVDGRLTRDAEVKINKTTGSKFLTFTIANNGFMKGEQITTFFNVVSYNDYDIERLDSFTKGTLVVVSGRPNEVMAIRDNKTYLNRNIMAHSIEKGTPNIVREQQTQQTVYRDVAPVVATCEIPQVVTAPKVETCEIPKVVTAPKVETPQVLTATQEQRVLQTYAAQINIPQQSNIETTVYNNSHQTNDDDLPF